MESIEQKVQTLKRPESKSAVEKFIDFLIQQEKGITQESAHDRKMLQEWSQFSITTALQGIENDEFPEYTKADLKEV